MQTQKSVESFGWQWSECAVLDSLATLYRRLFTDVRIWSDYLDGKVVADVGAGNGRHTWALAKLTKAKKLIAVELAEAAVATQRKILVDPRIEIHQGDAAFVEFRADFIFMLGFIQHVSDPVAVMRKQVNNLNDGGEIVVSFYMRTPATMAMEPVRWVTRRLPKKMLWAISPLLAPVFMVRKTGRESGFGNAVHTAYDWFGGHHYQRYFTETQIHKLFRACAIHPCNVLRLHKGLYRVRKGAFTPVLSTDLIKFGGRV